MLNKQTILKREILKEIYKLEEENTLNEKVLKELLLEEMKIHVQFS